jgi:hypothetical protein
MCPPAERRKPKAFATLHLLMAEIGERRPDPK